MHDQPQRKRKGRSRPASEAELALRSAIATRQHAEARGYELKPGTRRQYKSALQRLRRGGYTPEEAYAYLKPEFAQEATP
jgi:hypothetical protein